VTPVKYELGPYIPEDDIIHSHRRENLTAANMFAFERNVIVEEFRLLRYYAVWLL
jgi:hypothetical protein